MIEGSIFPWLLHQCSCSLFKWNFWWDIWPQKEQGNMFLLSILYLQKIQNTSFCLLWEQLQEKVILSYGILPQVFCCRQKFSTFLWSCHLMSVPFWSAHLFKSICTEFKNMDFFSCPPDESNCKRNNTEEIWSMFG